jgi:3-ketoacyl-CoA synthase
MEGKPTTAAPPAAKKEESAQLNLDDVPKYYYPDRLADMREVAIGYDKWKDRAVMIGLAVVLPALIIKVLSDYTKSSNIFALKDTIHLAVVEILNEHPSNTYLLFSITVCFFLLVLLFSSLYLLKVKSTVYMLDFATYQPPDELKMPHDRFMKRTRDVGWFTPESCDFQEKLLYRTGLGNETYFPPGIHQVPPDLGLDSARLEAEMVLSGCMDDLFQKTKLRPQDIDILIVNCSLFNPTPSLASMVINKYKLRSNIKSFNLSGMGCSASVIAIDLAKDLLQANRNSIAVVLSTENITQNWYTGNERPMLVQNTLFRMGGAGIVLTNKASLKYRCKYRLFCTVRVTKSAGDSAYKAIFQQEDPTGKKGVKLAPGKELLAVMGDALKTNLSTMGPMVLPWSEQIKFFMNLCMRKMFPAKKIPAYVPDFKLAFQHFCIHAGGRAVIDGLEQNLSLSPKDVEPSRATLYRYGNTSSSSIWYELNFIERTHHVKKGEKVWQIAIGSGFKCNSAVWVANRSIVW